ncbi:MAG: hypothetical protein SFV51_24250 [Bryobacteraceae bacterium]|nr:hypothetical protein [Bryobacteraceae bacterium]
MGYYWASKPEEQLSAAIRDIAAAADGPLTAKQLLERMAYIGKPAAALKAAIEGLLDKLAADGVMWKWPGRQGYWNRDPVAHARGVLLEIAAGRPFAEMELARELKSRIPQCQPKELIREAVSKGQLLYAGKPPFLYTKELLLREVLRAFAQSGSDPGLMKESPPAPSGAAQTVARVFEAIEARTNVLIPVQRLRAAPELRNLSKEEFDRAVLDLFALHRVMLHEHHGPYTLSESERRELVADGGERYYAGICWYGA